VDISQENYEKDISFDNIKLNDEKKATIEEQQCISNVNEEYITYDDNLDKLKQIRINNAFVDASKENKKEFSSNWKKFVDYLNINSEYTLLGLIENAEICVVSKMNVLFSFKNESESLIFNKNINKLEEKYNSYFKEDYKFISLSLDEWNNEKEKFISNKNKKYEYIDESTMEEDVESKDLASDIFGDDIIEIR